MSKKKIAIIGTVGIPAQYGGFETLAENLVRFLAHDYELTVFCSGKSYTKQRQDFRGAQLVYLPLRANGVQSIAYDFVAMLRSVREFDVLLVLGVSGCILLPFIKPFCKGKIVVNVDGLEWRREKWRGFPGRFLRFSEKMAACFADAIVADNKVIQDYILSAYGRSSALIAYGGDHAGRAALSDEVLNVYPFLSSAYAFSVCRIEPENNIHLILEAMSQQSNLSLVIIGNWRASDYGRDLFSRYANIAHFHLLDPVYDQSVLNQIRSNCKVYLHGHSAGGTNPSLVEAMYLKLPVFAFDVNYNRETTENAALYFGSVQALSALVVAIDTINITAIAEMMQEIASCRYCWKVIAQDYVAVFET